MKDQGNANKDRHDRQEERRYHQKLGPNDISQTKISLSRFSKEPENRESDLAAWDENWLQNRNS